MYIVNGLSIDEQNVVFKGRHYDNIRVTLNNSVDIFLVGLICANGYTFNWNLRNQPESL